MKYKFYPVTQDLLSVKPCCLQICLPQGKLSSKNHLLFMSPRELMFPVWKSPHCLCAQPTVTPHPQAQPTPPILTLAACLFSGFLNFLLSTVPIWQVANMILYHHFSPPGSPFLPPCLTVSTWRAEAASHALWNHSPHSQHPSGWAPQYTVSM